MINFYDICGRRLCVWEDIMKIILIVVFVVVFIVVFVIV